MESIPEEIQQRRKDQATRPETHPKRLVMKRKEREKKAGTPPPPKKPQMSKGQRNGRKEKQEGKKQMKEEESTSAARQPEQLPDAPHTQGERQEHASDRRPAP